MWTFTFAFTNLLILQVLKVTNWSWQVMGCMHQITNITEVGFKMNMYRLRLRIHSFQSFSSSIQKCVFKLELQPPKLEPKPKPLISKTHAEYIKNLHQQGMHLDYVSSVHFETPLMRPDVSWRQCPQGYPNSFPSRVDPGGGVVGASPLYEQKLK